MPAGHYVRLSKHSLPEKIDILRKMRDDIIAYTDFERVEVYIPLNEPWDGVFVIPDADVTLEQVVVGMRDYYTKGGDDVESASLSKTVIWLPVS